MGFFSSITKPFKKAFDWVGDNVGNALGFVGDVAGGLMGMSSSNKATAANSAYNDANLALAQASLAFQQQYAKQRLQWAKEDAQKSGFHPMVAAGLSPTSFSPVQASFTPAVAQDFDWVGKAGQNLSYAATKAKTNKQQAEMWNYTIGSAQQQLRSLQLDNTLKELEIASMGARLKQQAGGPAAPDLNGGKNFVGGQNDSGSTDDSFSTGTNPLLSLARVGNTLMAHINPDVSDSITEDIVRNQLANMNAEFQAGRLTPEVARHLSNNEKRMLARGEAELVYTPPSTWRFVLTPKMRPKYSNGGKEVSGKLNFSKLSY